MAVVTKKPNPMVNAMMRTTIVRVTGMVVIAAERARKVHARIQSMAKMQRKCHQTAPVPSNVAIQKQNLTESVTRSTTCAVAVGMVGIVRRFSLQSKLYVVCEIFLNYFHYRKTSLHICFGI